MSKTQHDRLSRLLAPFGWMLAMLVLLALRLVLGRQEMLQWKMQIAEGSPSTTDDFCGADQVALVPSPAISEVAQQ